MSHISYSALKDWSFCPFYHKLVYVDKLEAFRGNEYTAFGNAIHEVCEKKLLQQFVDGDFFVLIFYDGCPNPMVTPFRLVYRPSHSDRL